MYFKYVSIFYYANEAISITHWSKIKDIGERKINVIAPSSSMFLLFSIYLLINFPFVECPASCTMPCLLNGTEVLSEYGYNEKDFWWDMMGSLLLIILMNAAGYLGTRRRRTLKSIV